MGIAFILALLSTGSATSSATVDHKHIDIPLAYRGTWSLDAKLCKERDLGPAFVQIGARKISFYEEFGYLNLAQLNEDVTPPEFFGRFSFVHNLDFHEETIRLDMKGGKIFITRWATAKGLENRYPWVKCSADEG